MIKIAKDVYMETLSTLINDEDKLVTYKWLSKELEMHVNIAKQILSEYWELHKNDGISATFMLIGMTKEAGMRVEVVKDIDLEKALEKYDNLVSQHIYSLQKVLPDIEALARAGKGDPKFGAIRCKNSVILSDEELFERRWGSSIGFQAPFVEEKREERVKKEEKVEKKEEKLEKNEEKEEKIKENGKEKDKEVKKVSPPTKGKANDKKGAPKKPVQSTKAGFSNLFGKASSQKKPAVVKKDETTEKPKSSGFDNIFGKKSSQNDSQVSSASSTSSVADKKSPEKEKESKPEIDDDELMDVDASPPKENTKNSLKTKEKESNKSIEEKSNKKDKLPIKNDKKLKINKGKKRERSQENGENKKKRKRIIVHQSSDESGGSDKDDEEEEEVSLFDKSFIEESPPRKVSRSPSPAPVVQEIGGKRKIRKTIDESHIDEDGFLVTKKVHVMVSASEDDEPTPAPVKPKKKVNESTKLASSSKTKKSAVKQTTLTSFFKKA